MASLLSIACSRCCKWIYECHDHTVRDVPSISRHFPSDPHGSGKCLSDIRNIAGPMGLMWMSDLTCRCLCGTLQVRSYSLCYSIHAVEGYCRVYTWFLASSIWSLLVGKSFLDRNVFTCRITSFKYLWVFGSLGLAGTWQYAVYQYCIVIYRLSGEGCVHTWVFTSSIWVLPIPFVYVLDEMG